MSFKLNCPHCGQRLEAEDEWVGVDVPCPNCSRDFVVVKPGTTAAAPPRGGPQLQSAPLADTTKSCPFCGESIQTVAASCRHCGESLDGSGKQTTAGAVTAKGGKRRPATTGSRSRRNVGALVLFLVFLGVIYLGIGAFVVQPIGAVPDGATTLYWRFGTNMPFISSADGILVKHDQGVSILGRAVALAKVGQLLEGRRIVSLPYSRTLYLVSTGGREFEK